jgi:hypothetical protein
MVPALSLAIALVLLAQVSAASPTPSPAGSPMPSASPAPAAPASPPASPAPISFACRGVGGGTFAAAVLGGAADPQGPPPGSTGAFTVAPGSGPRTLTLSAGTVDANYATWMNGAADPSVRDVLHLDCELDVALASGRARYVVVDARPLSLTRAADGSVSALVLAIGGVRRLTF